jgi:transposase
MGKQGPKSKFIEIACPNEAYKDHGITGQRNMIVQILSITIFEKVKGSNNRNKARQHLSRIHETISNQRTNFQYQLFKESLSGSINFRCRIEFICNKIGILSRMARKTMNGFVQIVKPITIETSMLQSTSKSSLFNTNS